MTDYAAPVAELRFALDEIAGLPEIVRLQGAEAAEPDAVGAILEAAAKFAGEVISPLNVVGDRNPSRLENGVVRTPPGFREAYRQFIAGGWSALALPANAGGQGLPLALGNAVLEMWTSANLAFSLCSILTTSAAELMIAHGSPEQRRLYLAKLASGEWTGTMNLTEPQAGSDVGALRMRAVKDGAQYRLAGQKIFITYGDHDLAPNIVHMVLARVQGAPAGIRGISLFAVPKYLVGADGAPGAPNDIRCIKLEEKLGIHASPTCVLSFGEQGGAIGTIVGEENHGIEYMFLMMNGARLHVGIQGAAIAERAYQQARDYARSRVQGRRAGSEAGAALPIIAHADVRRMLLAMRADTEAARALLYYVAGELDRARLLPEAEAAQRHKARAELLLPVAKAWSTERGFEAASTNIQIHGGMGYIEETGAAQHLRDSRIALIYEGTNGIQAMDLVGRKLTRDEGAAAAALIAEMRSLDAALGAAKGAAFAVIRTQLHAGVDALARATETVLEAHRADPAQALGGAAPYLALMGLVAGGWLVAKAALAAQRSLDAGRGDAGFMSAKIATARFFAEHRLALAPALLPAAAGGGTIAEFEPDRF